LKPGKNLRKKTLRLPGWTGKFFWAPGLGAHREKRKGGNVGETEKRENGPTKRVSICSEKNQGIRIRKSSDWGGT